MLKLHVLISLSTIQLSIHPVSVRLVLSLVFGYRAGVLRRACVRIHKASNVVLIRFLYSFAVGSTS